MSPPRTGARTRSRETVRAEARDRKRMEKKPITAGAWTKPFQAVA